MMGGLEHWAHRLYPKATFDEFIERMEKLGSKREIQVWMLKLYSMLQGKQVYSTKFIQVKSASYLSQHGCPSIG
jgi:hypothetical protein